VQGAVDGRMITAGSLRPFGELPVVVPTSLSQAVDAAVPASRTVVLVSREGGMRAMLLVADQPKPSLR
jgi:cation transport ATPase